MRGEMSLFLGLCFLLLVRIARGVTIQTWAVVWMRRLGVLGSVLFLSHGVFEVVEVRLGDEFYATPTFGTSSSGSYPATRVSLASGGGTYRVQNVQFAVPHGDFSVSQLPAGRGLLEARYKVGWITGKVYLMELKRVGKGSD